MANITWQSGYVTYNGYNFFRVGVEGTASSTSTETTITAKTYIQLASGSHEGFWNFRGRTNAGGGYTGWASGGDAYIQDTNARQISSTTYKKARTTSNQTVTVYGQGYDSYLGTGTGTASQNVTVPKLDSYTVTYNANKPSAATGSVASLPSNQTKYYGINLTLSSTKPTLTNYNFKGWATSATGAVVYQPGNSYTGNSAVTLYAVWELAYVAPTITSLKVYRSDSSGNASEESTTHVAFELGWSFNQTGGTNTSGTAAFTWADSKGARSVTGVALSGQTGSVKKIYAAASGGTYDATKSYPVSVTITDAHNLKATKISAIPVVFAPLMARSKGHSVGILGTAPAISPDSQTGVYTNVLSIFGEVREHAAYDGIPVHKRYSSNLSTKVGSDIPSSNTDLLRSYYYDKDGVNCYYSSLVKTPTDDLYHSYVVNRNNASGTGKTSGFYVHNLANGDGVITFTGTNMVKNTKNEMVVGGFYTIFSGKDIATGGVIGTSLEVFKYRFYLITFVGGGKNWCLGYRQGGTMGRSITAGNGGTSTIYGVGAYDSGSGSYVFKTVIAVDANGKLTNTVSSQHTLASNGCPGDTLRIAAVYGIA